MAEKPCEKKTWTDEERANLARKLDQDLEDHMQKLAEKSKDAPQQDKWTEDNWREVQ